MGKRQGFGGLELLWIEAEMDRKKVYPHLGKVQLDVEARFPHMLEAVLLKWCSPYLALPPEGSIRPHFHPHSPAQLLHPPSVLPSNGRFSCFR